ncbi:MAG: hypothetical protein IJ848_02090 [Alphaproteobacteria bacterium]|nr:hypothetical protein [Alphaproteobacteria bacterium]
MNIFNIMKRASIGLGLLLVTTMINSSYYYANADTQKESSKKNKKDNKKEKNNKSKSSKKGGEASKEEIDAVKNMYTAFQDLINSNVTEGNVKSFYDNYFDSKRMYRNFGIKKNNKDEFDKALINYFVKLLRSDLIQKIKGYELTNDFSSISKKKSITIQCKLEKNGEDEPIKMSVILTSKNKKIKDFSIMQSFKLVKGARNIVENYCDTKNKKFNKLKGEERLQMCKEAWEQINNHKSRQ